MTTTIQITDTIICDALRQKWANTETEMDWLETYISVNAMWRLLSTAGANIETLRNMDALSDLAWAHYQTALATNKKGRT